ncbi:hypothetical protein SAMN05444354_13835 [Stigmatella aurantiaca]|uniref:Lipoprotein n=1 Tax=Stigmatella aurantiaca TaxID=41 RepID=A0A1H8FQD5_STIAU|nr:hypothetical protein [Stigmatella aurantiaca]SEN33879.1 hypothetical protein SAMN05444354_13835 [Stigmatella aurantiaca]
MKNLKTKALVAGLLAGTLTFVGCKSNSSMDRPESTTTPATDTMSTPPATDSTGTTGTTATPPGTGGSGSETRPSDDNLRMPEEDPLRTPQNESIRDSEMEPGIHHDADTDMGPGTGGSGMDNSMINDDSLNEAGDAPEGVRLPDSTTDSSLSPNDDTIEHDVESAEGAR